MSKMTRLNAIRLLLKLASRGLLRDKKRSIISLSAISLGLGLFIFSDQLQNGTYQSLIKLGVSTQAGHLVIEPRGARKNPEKDLKT